MHPLRPTLQQLSQELPPFNPGAQTEITPAIQAYLEYYRLRFPEFEYQHSIGVFPSNGFTLAAQTFRPLQPQGTVFILHGYLDHAGIIAPLIRYCLERNLAVAMYDLPGHGLSDGHRASIEQFPDYVAVFEDFLALCHPHFSEPYHLFSHSTGSAIGLEYLAHTPQSSFDKVVFLAPLVRHIYWHPAKVTYALGKLFAVKTVPRRSSELSSDSAFMEFLSRDPLITNRVPTQWVGALYDWEQDIRTIAPLSQPVLIVQGTRDTVVDGEYNVPFLQQKFPQARVKWIIEGRHQLVNESPDITQQVFQAIDAYLHS
jgi:alpha-beta hydrolase superfamily lysophospholipase